MKEVAWAESQRGRQPQVGDSLLCSQRAKGAGAVSVAGSRFKGRAIDCRCH